MASSWLRVAELVGELGELSVVDAGDTMDHLLRSVCEIVGSEDALLGFAVRDPHAPADDPLKGWRPPSPYRPRRRGPRADRDAALLDASYGSIPKVVLDAATIAVAASSGAVRAITHRDVMNERRGSGARSEP
jgi:hypothetical protein